ncbi:MAG: tRNA uridine-5-carboxymethylaminomethyl(34) synthesis GTPase MnmE [Bacteroidetes bacterium]|nr:MAG: tRNA uridine-5-carboxymethylaminomethyl(34) synthesis GTPase MnmE [Bacteroidota bacterium]
MNNPVYHKEDTICALATPAGTGAIAVLRVAGSHTFSILGKIFHPYGDTQLDAVESHKVVLGKLMDGENPVDEVLVTKFVAPHSYTGEDVVEISCHGSWYIQQEILRVLMDNGCRMASPGEFTLRAFLNGKMDLSQAEAVADLIASNSATSHTIAFRQMRGHFSKRIQQLRQQLLDFAGLIELELDFSEEDVEFANRDSLIDLLDTMSTELTLLIESFAMGNVLKNGIPVAIIGKPNVGKSTLLNAIFNEEKALVSDIPGTTRDTIEDVLVINGVSFRFIDTAGLRDSDDTIESMGIERTYEKIRQASIILYMFDAATPQEEINETIAEFREKIDDDEKQLILIANKIDLLEEMPHNFKSLVELETIFVSAKRKENINMISESLLRSVSVGVEEANQSVVASSRHYQALIETLKSLEEVNMGIGQGISGDLLSSDLKAALYHLGTITGEVTNDEILGNIFGRFCIGK